MQFLYADGTDAHFMDTESFDQIDGPGGDARRRAALDPAHRRGRPPVHRRPARRLKLPSAVELEVTETEPGRQGRHGVRRRRQARDARDRRGVQVPLFVNIGDRVRVDTRSGEYVSRA